MHSWIFFLSRILNASRQHACIMNLNSLIDFQVPVYTRTYGAMMAGS